MTVSCTPWFNLPSQIAPPLSGLGRANPVPAPPSPSLCWAKWNRWTNTRQIAAGPGQLQLETQRHLVEKQQKSVPRLKKKSAEHPWSTPKKSIALIWYQRSLEIREGNGLPECHTAGSWQHRPRRISSPEPWFSILCTTQQRNRKIKELPVSVEHFRPLPGCRWTHVGADVWWAGVVFYCPRECLGWAPNKFSLPAPSTARRPAKNSAQDQTTPMARGHGAEDAAGHLRPEGRD